MKYIYNIYNNFRLKEVAENLIVTEHTRFTVLWPKNLKYHRIICHFGLEIDISKGIIPKRINRVH